MIPGEVMTATGDIEINAGRPTVTLTVTNTGDRPIQVGSHYHFYETNTALVFDREQARGYRLDIPAGTTGGPACITTGGGKCVENVTCNGGSCSGGPCGQPHCGTLTCNDGSYTMAQYCSVVASCDGAGIVVTGFTW